MIGTAAPTFTANDELVTVVNNVRVDFPEQGLTLRLYRHERPEDEGRKSVAVADDLALAEDPRLAELSAREQALGDNRNLERGFAPEIDALYDELNAQWLSAYAAIARRAVTLLVTTGLVSGDTKRAIDGITGDRNALGEGVWGEAGATLGAPLFAKIGSSTWEITIYVSAYKS